MRAFFIALLWLVGCQDPAPLLRTRADHLALMQGSYQLVTLADSIAANDSARAALLYQHLDRLVAGYLAHSAAPRTPLDRYTDIYLRARLAYVRYHLGDYGGSRAAYTGALQHLAVLDTAMQVNVLTWAAWTCVELSDVTMARRYLRDADTLASRAGSQAAALRETVARRRAAALERLWEIHAGKAKGQPPGALTALTTALAVAALRWGWRRYRRKREAVPA